MTEQKNSKSKFFPPIKTHEGLLPQPGVWAREVGLNKLETIAKNLKTPPEKDLPDKLHSVPSPWARLLLFESALYDREHPAHIEVRNQWRGLMALLGMAEIFIPGSVISIKHFDLNRQRDGELKRAFQSLKPQHIVKEGDKTRDLEEKKWDNFSLIYLDNKLIGATSPRTLVFTGVSHQCPKSIPFRSPQGRISDPTEYFKKTGNQQFLGILKQWLIRLLEAISDNENVSDWLGERPTSSAAQITHRQRQLIEVLEEWKDDIGDTESSIPIIIAEDSRFPAFYGVLKHINTAGISLESDLFYRGRYDLIVAFQPDNNSYLVNAHGNQVIQETLTIYNGHKLGSGEHIGDNFSFLPKGISVIKDPVTDLFEDTLVEFNTTFQRNVHSLFVKNKNFLLPLRKEVLTYFSEAELIELVNRLEAKAIDSNTIDVSIKLPVRNGRFVEAHKNYKFDQNIITIDHSRHATQDLAMWPNFACYEKDHEGNFFFEHYFYFTDGKKSPGRDWLEFEPLIVNNSSNFDIVKRDYPDKGRTWYMSKRPLLGFIGSVEGKQGLLLIKYETVGAPNKLWKVSVDFGSTHTNLFSLEVENRHDKWVKTRNSKITSLSFKPRVCILTQQGTPLDENFFFFAYDEGNLSESALSTQLVLPLGQSTILETVWLPREGQVFKGSILNGGTRSKLETNLKWNVNQDDQTTSAFLRSLMIMTEAEAIAQQAQIVYVTHSYPTAFPRQLVIKHNNEWNAIQNCVHLSVEQKPISEAIAVCRHLLREGATPGINMIALDIGGSTTDIAIWASEQLRIQESIKLAAGTIIHLISKDNLSKNFREWLVKMLNMEQPFSTNKILLPSINEESIRDNPAIFQAILKSLSERGMMDKFIEKVNATSMAQMEIRTFIYPIVLLFSTISYFTGLLVRKAKLPENQGYDIFFCGKGGQLLNWIPNGERVVREHFIAGLRGKVSNIKPPTIRVEMSKYPKEEVGRGLLIEREFQEQIANHTSSMFEELAATTTIAESGFESSWDDNLDFEKLVKIKEILDKKVNVEEAAPEITNFVKVFQSDFFKDIRDQFQIEEAIKDTIFSRLLYQRISNYVRKGQNGALIEPLFITEAKVLMEKIFDQPSLFDEDE